MCCLRRWRGIGWGRISHRRTQTHTDKKLKKKEKVFKHGLHERRENSLKVLLIAGARPNFMKIAPIY